MTSAEIRQTFLEFFRSKGHHIVPSAPIVVKNDPTLLFTNAGMNQFKDYFLGNRKPEYTRVADTQKCLRVSGKHNDLEEVGVDTYHHTMFEMLGNWSFGDYFKKDAIAWAWELLIEKYGIDRKRLYVTIFEGDEKEGLPRDSEAFDEWKKWVPADRILLGRKKDNFWEMGDTGPCGPCTEIHYDSRGEAEREVVDGKTLVNQDHPQVIEIWNVVFIQFNRLKDGSLEPLPARHVDTGMGFERLVRVLQNKRSNYDTDIFSGTIDHVAAITGQAYDGGDGKQAIAFRVIADHIRAISFTIADGQLPSNTGAGYVIRRILRRAVRYYYSYLDYRQPLLCQLVGQLAEQFRDVFPELAAQQEFVARVIREEEEAFLRTLGKGLRKIEDIIGAAKSTGNDHIEGRDVFELLDTYGFPVDLTRLIAAENNLRVDERGFEEEMQQQKQRSRAATAIDTEDWIVLDDFALNEFVGYDSFEVKTRVVKYRKVKAKGRESYQIVLEATPFYAEGGGQVGDTGTLEVDGVTVDIVDTKRENNLIVHFSNSIPTRMKGDVVARVDAKRRKATQRNHSATHLLHAALRQVLGPHVTQKGSLVNSSYLRFDFSHFAKLTDQEIDKIESIVNEKIRENIPVVIRRMKKEEALSMGAMALFGEKYGDVVRVVVIDPTYSVELCGGTHAGSTGDLGFFKITHETAVAAGVRRIEAVTGEGAEAFVAEQSHRLKSITELLKNPKDPVKSIESVINENADLKKKVEALTTKQLALTREELLGKPERINGVNFVGAVISVDDADSLKKLCFDLKKELTDYVVVLASNIGGKAGVAIMIDDAVSERLSLNATAIIKETIAPVIKGGGGGQKTLATAGGQDASNLPQVVEKVKALLGKE